MTELLEDLEEQRSKLNKKAEQYRRRRDKFNNTARRWADKRDKLNGQSRENIEKANSHRKERDTLNDLVKKAKEERENWNKKVSEAQSKLGGLKKKHLPKDGITLEKLKREVRNLEFKQQTTVLSVEKERELLELLSDVQSQIREREKLLEGNKEIQEALKKRNEAKEKAEDAHGLVSEHAESAQKEHDAMCKFYDEGDRLRREADGAQIEFKKAKLAADEAHKNHVEMVRQVHDFDKIIAGLRQKKARASREIEETTAKKEAEDIYERFKAGEKLSTEDLMFLQKAGYL
ncbi:MAG: phosphoserine phosphatase [Methanomassiliicoccales archaeon]|nr:MAG: phosphoserine phosphatase [Methanomassiliicoccales archaeon]